MLNYKLALAAITFTTAAGICPAADYTYLGRFAIGSTTPPIAIMSRAAIDTSGNMIFGGRTSDNKAMAGKGTPNGITPFNPTANFGPNDAHYGFMGISAAANGGFYLTESGTTDSQCNTYKFTSANALDTTWASGGVLPGVADPRQSSCAELADGRLIQTRIGATMDIVSANGSTVTPLVKGTTGYSTSGRDIATNGTDTIFSYFKNNCVEKITFSGDTATSVTRRSPIGGDASTGGGIAYDPTDDAVIVCTRTPEVFIYRGATMELIQTLTVPLPNGVGIVDAVVVDRPDGGQYLYLLNTWSDDHYISVYGRDTVPVTLSSVKLQ